MAIEGPLRELGIHDVFQLLDLSRKTGILSITSPLRDNQGAVFFERGAVVFAAIRTNPHPLGELLLRAGKITESDLARARDGQTHGDGSKRLGDLLVEAGAISRKELERQVRFQVEEVIFELMSWREGFFSFEERAEVDAPAEANIRISTESLLMEAARRIDEWSRIEAKVPNLDVVAVLADVGDDHPGFLELLPREWEVLSEIDGERNLRAIARAIAHSDFDVARVIYGLITTGIVALKTERPLEPEAAPTPTPEPDAPVLEPAREALRSGDAEGALAAANAVLTADVASVEARLVVSRALMKLGRPIDAAEALRAALNGDALNPSLHRELGFCAAWRGDLLAALGSWERYLRMQPAAADASHVRAVADAASRLRDLLQEHLDV